MAKGISSVIAILLMLVITITIVGFSYTYISGVVDSRVSDTFSVVDVLNDTITISNDGASPTTSITATLDNNPITIAVMPNILGLVAYWSLNEGNGNIAHDTSGYNNHGALVNMSAFGNGTSGWNNTNCRSGTCMQFDGINDEINVTSSPSLNVSGAFTVMGWVNPFNSANTNGQQVLGKYNYLANQRSFDIQVGQRYGESNGVFAFIVSSTGANRYAVITNIPINNNVWYYVVGVYDGSSSTIYVNGANVSKLGNSDNTVLTPLYQSSASFTVGAYDGNSASTDYFKGMVDEVAVYNRALTPDEISSLYAGLLLPGKLATIKLLTPLTPGSHNLKLCTTSKCNPIILRMI